MKKVSESTKKLSERMQAENKSMKIIVKKKGKGD